MELALSAWKVRKNDTHLATIAFYHFIGYRRHRTSSHAYSVIEINFLTLLELGKKREKKKS